jgi:hypothetical protein
MSCSAFNTTAAVCVVHTGGVNGWNGSNLQGRTVTVTGSTTPITPSGGSIVNQPAVSPGSDGNVYFNFTAGMYTYAAMACW